MHSKFAKSVALVAGIHILGGHWLALQVVAWVGMFAMNSQEASLSTALEKTFDGKHPCPLCAAVESGQQEEKDDQQKSLVDPVNKVNGMPLAAIDLPQPTAAPLSFFETTETADIFAVSPPSPPPWRA